MALVGLVAAAVVGPRARAAPALGATGRPDTLQRRRRGRRRGGAVRYWRGALARRNPAIMHASIGSRRRQAKGRWRGGWGRGQNGGGGGRASEEGGKDGRERYKKAVGEHLDLDLRAILVVPFVEAQFERLGVLQARLRRL